MEAHAEIFPKTLTLQMDFDKSLKTPKVTAQDAYYKLKLKTHQMGIYCANNKTIHCFLYDETIGTTGPNEVISLLDYLLKILEGQLGKYDHIIIWCDNAPGQFKECYLFFYLDHLIRKQQFLRADLKFLLEGHTYSVCDRRFGTIQRLFKNREVVDVPKTWADILQESNLSNTKVHWVTIDMIQDYKSFLRIQYVSRNEDVDKEKFEVKEIAWLNFGYGERIDDDGQLQLVFHPESVFMRSKMNVRQQPRKVSFIKKKQGAELRPEYLSPVRQERRPVKADVKRDCLQIAQKYLSKSAVQFYRTLPSIEEENDSS